MVVGYSEVVTASIGAKGGSFPLIGVMGKLYDTLVVTKRCGGVHIMVELRRAHGCHELGQGVGFPSNQLHGRVRRVMVKLNG